MGTFKVMGPRSDELVWDGMNEEHVATCWVTGMATVIADAFQFLEDVAYIWPDEQIGKDAAEILRRAEEAS